MTARNFLLLLVSGGTFALAGSGCGGDTPATPAPTPTPTTPTPPPPPPPPGAGRADDHGDMEQTATVIALPSTTRGVLEEADDVDYFRLDIPSSGMLTVETTGSTDTSGVLTGPGGFGERTDDDSGAEGNFRIVASVSPGVHYVGVRGDRSSVGQYALRVQFHDHGDTEQTATEIGLPSTTQGVLDHVDDVDYFRLDIPSSGVLTVETTGSTDTSGVLTGPGGVGERTDDDSGAEGNFRIVAPVSPGVHYVGVRGDRSSVGQYALRVQFHDHGETEQTATEIGLPSTTQGVLDHVDDVDYFRLDIPSAGTLIVHTTGSTDTDGAVTGPGGVGQHSEDVSNLDDEGNFRIRVPVSPGVHYVRVRGSGSSLGEYELHVQIDDHGDTERMATEIGLPSDTRGDIQHWQDIDYFRVEVSDVGRLIVYTTGSTDIQGLLSGPGDFSIGDDDSGSGRNFRIVAPVSPGVYHLQLIGYMHRKLGEYELHVRFDDHGDTEQTATEIELPSHTEGALERADDVDYFRVETPDTGILTVYTTGSTDTSGELAGPGDVGERSDDDSGDDDNFRITARLAEGVYYVAVRSRSEVGAYTLHVKFEDHGDTEGTATLIEVPSTTEGDLEHEEDIDVFRIQVRSNEYYNNRPLVVYTTGDTDVTCTLSGTGSFVDNEPSDDNSGPGSNCRIVAWADFGDYYVRVSGSRGAVGEYEIWAEFDDHSNDPISVSRYLTEVEVPSTTDGNIQYLDFENNIDYLRHLDIVGDVDFFRFSIPGNPRTGTLIVYTTGSTDTTGVLFLTELIHLSEEARDGDSGSGLNFRIELPLAGIDFGSSDWDGFVIGVSGNTVGRYELHVEFSEDPPPADDHGDTESTATVIGLPSITQGEIEVSGDADYFRFQLRSSARLTVYTTGSTDTVGVLTGPNVIASNDDGESGSNFQIVVPSASPGTYFVGVTGFQSERGRYELHVEFSEDLPPAEDPPPADDHGDTESTATVIGLPSITQGEIEVSGDADYFRFQLRSSARLTVYTTGTTDTVGDLTGSNVMASDDDSGSVRNFRIEVPGASPGTYFVRVTAFGNGRGEYELHMLASEEPGGSGGGGNPARGEITECTTRLPDFIIRIGGTITANRDLRDVRVLACARPLGEQIECERASRYFVNDRFLGTVNAGQSRSWSVSARNSILVPMLGSRFACQAAIEYREASHPTNAVSRHSLGGPKGATVQRVRRK